MKKTMYMLLLSVPLFTLWFCTSSSSVKDKTDDNLQTMNMPEHKKTAVLELFTSQGCSSCPSADKLLEKYSSNENVITLSFHVDYWNRLGWKDPYSSQDFTKRQYSYASALNAGVYTPQLVINGQSEMVGSDARKIESTLKKVSAQEQNSEISIQSVNIENGKATINYTITGNAGSSLLNVAIVEKKTLTSIKSGENGGVTLSGTNVVRNFKTLSQPEEGKKSLNIDVPSGINKENMSVVLYLQKTNSEITAACQAAAM